MSALAISVTLNAYLIVGIVLYSLNRGAALRDKSLLHQKRFLFSLYIAAVILLWPVSPYFRWKINEHYSTYF